MDKMGLKHGVNNVGILKPVNGRDRSIAFLIVKLLHLCRYLGRYNRRVSINGVLEWIFHSWIVLIRSGLCVFVRT